MSLASATVLANEAAEQSGHVNGFWFGLAAFGILVVALIVTTMVNVDH